MGVPALFRWLSAKYPKIVQPVVEVREEEVGGVLVPANMADANPNGVEFDNLYLDMNGIIHPCCHPENQDAPPTEQDMMLEIFKYIDRIMGMVRPRKLLYLAIDGVAPRAKMNQQRSRRFRAAMEAMQKAEAARLEDDEDGGSVADEAFDSNCITPGTPFMKLVSESLRFYTIDRISNNAAWRDVKVIFSDASVPGEGEHKIMDFIRRQRLDPSYDPNTKHVIYGLDADLIMLSMATHEPYFKVLREDVFADERVKTCHRCKRPGHYADSCPGLVAAAEAEAGAEYKLLEKPFIFLDIPILREYLEAEMRPAHELPYRFVADRAIDDWIFLCFFVGNDFLPHLPSLEIREGAIDILLDIYKQNAHRLGGYICRDGVVNLARVEIIMGELGKLEELIFRKRREKEERRLEGAKRRRFQAGHADERDEYRKTQMALHQMQAQTQPQTQMQAAPVPVHAVAAAADAGENSEIVRLRAKLREQNMAAARAMKLEGFQQATPSPPPVLAAKRAAADAFDEPADNVRLWEPGAQDRYYQAKFHIDPTTDQAFVQQVVQSYVEGLCWVMAYYYQGCPSWKWFYPYHYAPFASNLTGLGERRVRFELGEPFRPFDQLMGVFPAASSVHIPEPFRPLMSEADSEVIDFYPETFHIDMNGKKAAWQGVALLPFIDEERLLGALEKVYPSLTPEQVRLNARGDPKLFAHAASPPCLPEGLEAADEERLLITLDPAECANLAGIVKLDRSFSDVGRAVPSPLDQIARVAPVACNQVRCFHFQLPYHERRGLHFRSGLLPSVTLPPRVLTDEDRQLVHSGAASRSFQSRLVLGNGGSGVRPFHHSMHQEHAHQEQAAERRSHADDRRAYRPDDRREPRPEPRYEQRGPPRASSNPYAALAPRRPEEHYPPPPSHMQPYPPPPPGYQPASSAFHRPQPPAKPRGDPLDDLYGIRRPR